LYYVIACTNCHYIVQLSDDIWDKLKYCTINSLCNKFIKCCKNPEFYFYEGTKMLKLASNIPNKSITRDLDVSIEPFDGIPLINHIESIRKLLVIESL